MWGDNIKNMAVMMNENIRFFFSAKKNGSSG